MIYNILKYFYRIIRKPIDWIRSKNKKYFNLILPNYVYFFSKRINLESYPVCNQKIVLSGRGHIEVGSNCIFGTKIGGFNRWSSFEIQPRFENSKIKIGNNVSTNNNIFLCSAKYIEIGDDTLIGQNVSIMDFEAHCIDPNKRKKIGEIKSILIGKNVWIGNNVTILKNTEIGDNTIVATGAVVSGKFPDNVVIGGVPAKIIKSI